MHEKKYTQIDTQTIPFSTFKNFATQQSSATTRARARRLRVRIHTRELHSKSSNSATFRNCRKFVSKNSRRNVLFVSGVGGAAGMSSTDSESESCKGEEEEEEEEPQKSSEEGEEEEEEEAEEEADEEENEEEEEEEENEAGDAEEEEEEDEKEGENGHTSQVDEPVPRSSKRRRKSTSSYGAVANGNGSGSKSRSSSSSKPMTKVSSLTTLAFPIGRVRRLVKSEVDVNNVGADAGFLIAKATELFLEKFVADAFDKMTEDERTVLNYSDLASHVSATERYDFLADFVPETLPASTALATKVQHADR